MSSHERKLRVLLLAVVAAGVGPTLAPRAQSVPEGTAAAGGAPGSSHPLEFSADLSTSANHRDRPTLTGDNDSATTGRLSIALGWALRSETTHLFASLNPYMERFTGEDRDLSSYGGTAGLGLRRRASPRFTWDVDATVRAAPEQDLELPQTSEEAPVPAVTVLVPRNGIIATSLGVSGRTELSTASRLDLGVSGYNARYNEYAVDAAGVAQPSLVDNRTLGASAAYERRTSERHTWSIAGDVSRFTLHGGVAATNREARDQGAMRFSSNLFLSSRTAVGVGVGVSAIETGDGGTDLIPVLNARWSLREERKEMDVSFVTNQGIFPGSDVSTNFASMAGRMRWQVGPRSRFNVGAGYGLSRVAGASNSSEGETRTRNLSGGYAMAFRRIGWSVSVARNRQDSGLGPDLETTVASASLAWRLAGRSS